MAGKIDSVTVEMLRDKISQIDELLSNPEQERFSRWHAETQLTLEHIFGEKSDKIKTFRRYNGSLGLYFMDEPKHELEQRKTNTRISDLKAAKSFLLGLLDFMEKISGSSPVQQRKEIQKTEDSGSTHYRHHPVISSVAGPLFNDGHYRDAIRAAYIEVIDRLKEKTGRRRSNNGTTELDGTKLIEATFAGESPKLSWSSMETTAEKDFQQGIFYLFKGVAFLRNEKGHVNVEQKDKEKAYEYLCLASLLMRQIDEATSTDSEE